MTSVLAALRWWLVLELLGLVALPLSMRLFRHLPSRGYAFSKPLGWLLVGYLFWLGGMFGFLSNTAVAALFALVLVGLLSAYVWSREGEEMRRFLFDNRRVVIAMELVFLIAFAGWAFVRAHNPEIASTEKPMEIGFLNAILRSPRMPPHDPWLSGFGISYYYFGYVLVSIVTTLSRVASTVAFNLAIASLFGLTALGSFGLVHDLIATDRGSWLRRSTGTLAWSLLGPLFVLVLGNLEGILEVLHTRGIGSEAFWRAIDVHGLVDAPINGRWVPTDDWWWWRASRVINDRDLLGSHMEVIDEFPQFSFLLADMHPHVLDLPFVLLAAAFALNLLLGARAWACADSGEETPVQSTRPWDRWPVASSVWRVSSQMTRTHAFDILFLAISLGALGFINTWDLPVYLLLIVGAFFVGQRVTHCPDHYVASLVFAACVAVPAIALYLPFYLTFQSQAGGVLPTLFTFSRVHQFLLMFGLFIFCIGGMAAYQILHTLRTTVAPGEETDRLPLPLAEVDRRVFLYNWLNWFLWFLVGPILLMLVAVVAVLGTTSGREFVRNLLADPTVQAAIGSGGLTGLLRRVVLLRFGHPWTVLLLAVLISMLAALIQLAWSRRPGEYRDTDAAPVFANWMAGVGLVLPLATEYIYLRDTFGTRMNTIFKFYYQAWVLMAIAAAFGVYYILGRGHVRLPHLVWGLACLALVLASLVYPVFAIPNKTGGFAGPATLDGMEWLKVSRPDDYGAVMWLKQNEPGISYIVEATGGSFSEYAFVSSFTGLPTMLGWGGHELQWRGNYDEPARREPDIQQIYSSSDGQQVLSLLEKYNVRYVYLGANERRKYMLPPNTADRLARVLQPVYQQGDVAIFRRRP